MERSSLLLLFSLILVWWTAIIQAGEVSCQSVPFRHPYANGQKNLTSEQVYASYRGFCLTYPRCLAFNCCDKELSDHVAHVHATAHCSAFAPFQCMMSNHGHGSGCSYNVSFAERIANLPILKEALTVNKLYDDLLALTPTSPQVLKALEHRCEFRVLYLIQGDDRKSAAPFVTQSGADFLFLNYKTHEPGILLLICRIYSLAV